MQSAKYLLSKHALNSIDFSNSFDIGHKLQAFILESFSSNVYWFRQISEEVQQFFTSTLKLLQSSQVKDIENIWVKMLLIDAFLMFASIKWFKKEMIDWLNKLCDEIEGQINRYTQKYTKKDDQRGVMNRLTRSISSLIHYKSPTAQPNQKQSSNNDFKTKLLFEILTYIRKKLQNYRFLTRITKKDQNPEDLALIDSQIKSQQLQQLRQTVWKVLNIIRHHGQITKAYKRIYHIETHLKPLFVATAYFLAKDCLILYPSITRLVQTQAKMITQKYTEISVQRGQKQLKQKKIQKLSKDPMFIQTKCLLQQLAQINQTMFYIFCGKQHNQYLKIKIPQNYFLSTVNPRLDQIHGIIKQKHKKTKLHMSAIKEKLDESVSSKINRIKSSLTQEMQMQKIICDKDNTSKEQDVNYYGEEIIEDI